MFNNPLLIILVIQKATEVGRKGLIKLLYENYLVVIAALGNEAIERFEEWKNEME